MLARSAMMRKLLVAFAPCIVTVQTVHADPLVPFYSEPTDDGGVRSRRSESVWSDPHIFSGIGIGIAVGGGVIGFVDDSMRNTTGNVGGLWSLRGALGTHVPLALELGYSGSATSIDTELGRADAVMVGTAVEAAVRYNVAPRRTWTPYAFAGLGWQRYTIDDTAFQLSDTGIGNRDDLLVVPLGVGLSYRFGPLVSDVRGTFRAATGEGLVLETPEVSLATGSGRFAPMHSWDTSLNIGYEF
jgi:hypothetical protein